MAFDKDAFLTALDSMTVLELNDLVKAIEEKFGVSAAAMAAPAAGGGGAAAAVVEEKTEFTVMLTETGAKRIYSTHQPVTGRCRGRQEQARRSRREGRAQVILSRSRAGGRLQGLQPFALSERT